MDAFGGRNLNLEVINHSSYNLLPELKSVVACKGGSAEFLFQLGLDLVGNLLDPWIDLLGGFRMASC